MSKIYTSLSVLNKYDTETVDRILSKPIKILCKNFETEQHEINTLNILYKQKNRFWNDNVSTWAYYVLEEDILMHLGIEENTEKFHGFTESYGELLSLSSVERVEALISSKQKLQNIDFKSDKNNREISEAVVAGTTDTILLNKVILEDLMKLTPEIAKIHSKAAVDETSEIVKIATHLLSDYSGDFSIFSKMIEESNGTTIKHMTRTFVMTLSFLKYYNHLLNSGYAAKVRVKFSSVYRDQYEKIFPKEEDSHLITLERVFMGGMASIPEIETNAIGIGFLLHDLGKQVDLEYFEGSEGYVKERIQAHATNGFNELLKRTVYPPVVSAIAGFHHEYYGDESGYGPLRGFISRKFPNKIRSEYFLSYSLKDVYNGEAQCFFPAKMLELVDVYDALTDPGRKYRIPLKPVEAIEFIRDKFLKKHTKIDPILFDMFELYLIDAGEIVK